MKPKRTKLFHKIFAGGAALMLLFSVFTLSFQAAKPVYAKTVGEVAKQKDIWENQLEELRAQIAQDTEKYAKQQDKSASLQNEIAKLETQISKAKHEIQARNIMISQLSGNISSAQEKLKELNAKIEKARLALSNLIRETDKKDDSSLALIIFGSDNFSDFFSQVQANQVMRENVKARLDLIKDTSVQTKSKKEELSESRVKQQDLKQIQLLQKASIEDSQDEKADLLKRSKSRENFYEDTIASKKAQVEQIKSALFNLRNPSSQINFGEALRLAKEVHRSTGVRPAFLLAILTQESAIGKNVGSCNIPGKTPNRMWDTIMPGPDDKASGKSGRDDQTIYLNIVKSLGLSPTAKPLSCPQSIGWGGAMGPAQFIPSTWAMFSAQIAKYTGSPTPNPWKPRDAFYASGIYLSQLGAKSGTRAGEMEAAGRYFAGSNWNDPQTGRLYATQVLNKAAFIQKTKIDPIEAADS